MGKEFQEFVAHKRARKRDVKINNKNRVEKHSVRGKEQERETATRTRKWRTKQNETVCVCV